MLSSRIILCILICKEIHGNIVEDILQYNNIKEVLVFSCNKIKKDISFQKELNDKMVKSVVITRTSNRFSWYTFSKRAFVFNDTCGYWPSRKYLDNKAWLSHPNSWIIVTTNLNNTVKTLSDYPIEIASDVTIILEKDQNYSKLYEIYNTGFYYKGQFKLHNYGVWNKSLSKMNRSKRTDMTGVVLKCMVVFTLLHMKNETFESYMEKAIVTTDSIHRLKAFVVLQYLRDMYHFSFDLKRTKSWGYFKNGSFDGMVGALQRKEIDLSGSPFFFRADRASVLWYTSQTWSSKHTFLFRHPKVGTYFSIFTRPLAKSTWYSALALVSLLGLVLCSLLQHRRLRRPPDDQDTSISSGLLAIWSAVCQQGNALNRSSITIRLVVLSTFVFTIPVYQYYNGTVVSELLREPPKTIRTLTDLLNSDIKIGIDDALYNRDYFKRTTDPVALELYARKVLTPTSSNFFNITYGMARVKRGGFAFHVDNVIGYRLMRETFTERELCEVQEVPLYPPQQMVLAVPKGSPYREIITYGIRRAYEAGLMQRIQSVWDAPRAECPRGDAKLRAVTLPECAAPLAALLGGATLATLLLAVEVLVERCRRRGDSVLTYCD